MATMTLPKEKTSTMKVQLKDILLAISWADLSRTYFQNRAHGYIISWME